LDGDYVRFEREDVKLLIGEVFGGKKKEARGKNIEYRK
jgi:hypothetical protein